MTLLSRISITVISLLMLSACGGGGSDTTSDESLTLTTTDSSQIETGADGYSIELSAHQENTLMALLDISIEKPAKAFVTFYSTSDDSRELSSEDYLEQHNLTLVGMRSNTEYTIEILLEFEDGAQQLADTQQFITGALPDSAPTVTLSLSDDDQSDGITFFGTGVGNRDDPEDPLYWGVDNSGAIVWYLHDTSINRTNPIIRKHTNGNLLVLTDSALLEISSAGDLMATYDFSSVDGAHHDAILLPSGNLLVLGIESGTFNGLNLKGDTINEVDSEGNVIWQWSSFEHLDVNRFPGDLSTRDTNGYLDWTHANALSYRASDNSILLSSRSQSWVVNIDHDSGNVKWILGSDALVAEGFEAKFFDLSSGSWMANQHAAMFTNDGDILLYDNRNESGGSNENSRGVRFQIDTDSMTADQRWESIASKYTSSLGDIDELDTGNALICAGGPGSDNFARIYEADGEDNGRILWEIIVDSSVYRAERLSWEEFLATTQ